MGDSSNDCGSSMGLVPYSEQEMANRKTQTEKIKRRGGLGRKTAPRSWAPPPHSSHSRRRSRPGRRHSIPSHVMGAARMVLLCSWCDPSPTKKTQIIGRSVSLRLMAWHVPNAGCSYCVSWVDTKQGSVEFLDQFGMARFQPDGRQVSAKSLMPLPCMALGIFRASYSFWHITRDSNHFQATVVFLISLFLGLDGCPECFVSSRVRKPLQIIKPDISAQNHVQVPIPAVLAVVLGKSTTGQEISMPSIRNQGRAAFTDFSCDGGVG